MTDDLTKLAERCWEARHSRITHPLAAIERILREDRKALIEAIRDRWYSHDDALDFDNVLMREFGGASDE